MQKHIAILLRRSLAKSFTRKRFVHHNSLLLILSALLASGFQLIPRRGQVMARASGRGEPLDDAEEEGVFSQFSRQLLRKFSAIGVGE